MTNIRFKTVDEYNDLQTRNRYNLELKKSKEAAAAYLLNQAELSRDNSRTPMQWSSGPNAGFTTGKPWLTINPNFTKVNVDESEKDPNSILNYVKKMIALRKEHKDVLVYGKYTLLDKDNKQVYSYTRESGNKKFLVLLNFTSASSKASTGIDLSKAKILINNYDKPATDGSLRPYEAVVYEL